MSKKIFTREEIGAAHGILDEKIGERNWRTIGFSGNENGRTGTTINVLIGAFSKEMLKKIKDSGLGPYQDTTPFGEKFIEHGIKSPQFDSVLSGEVYRFRLTNLAELLENMEISEK